MDDFQFCRDLLYFGQCPVRRTVQVIGNPWDPMNWEVTEVFLAQVGVAA